MIHKSLRPSFFLFALFSLFAGAAGRVHSADLPSAPTDPKMAEVFAQAKAAFEKAESPGYMDMPADAKPWPCAVTELQLRTWAGALGSDEYGDKARKIREMSLSAAGMNPKDNKITISDVRHAPVAAACVAGKLDGPLEFIIEYTHTMDLPSTVVERRTRNRISLTISSGEKSTTGSVTITSLHLSDKTTWKDPAVNATMEEHSRKQPRSLVHTSTYAALPLNVDDAYSATIIESRTGGSGREWMTAFSQPTAPNRSENSTYRGTALWMASSTQNGLQNGEQRTYPTTFSGIQLPGSTKCYVDGAEIKTTPCDVDSLRAQIAQGVRFGDVVAAKVDAAPSAPRARTETPPAAASSAAPAGSPAATATPVADALSAVIIETAASRIASSLSGRAGSSGLGGMLGGLFGQPSAAPGSTGVSASAGGGNCSASAFPDKLPGRANKYKNDGQCNPQVRAADSYREKAIANCKAGDSKSASQIYTTQYVVYVNNIINKSCP